MTKMVYCCQETFDKQKKNRISALDCHEKSWEVITFLCKKNMNTLKINNELLKYYWIIKIIQNNNVFLDIWEKELWKWRKRWIKKLKMHEKQKSQLCLESLEMIKEWLFAETSNSFKWSMYLWVVEIEASPFSQNKIGGKVLNSCFWN